MRKSKRQKPKIFFYPPLQRWAIMTPFLKPVVRMREYTFILNFKFEGEYHSAGKVWTIPESHLEEVKQHVEHYFGQFDFNPAKPQLPPKIPTERKIDYLELFCSITGASRSVGQSLQALKALYRQTAARIHPDVVGGDSDKMANLNVAYKELQKERS